jgi:hypothetical protein
MAGSKRATGNLQAIYCNLKAIHFSLREINCGIQII